MPVELYADDSRARKLQLEYCRTTDICKDTPRGSKILTTRGKHGLDCYIELLLAEYFIWTFSNRDLKVPPSVLLHSVEPVVVFSGCYC